MSQTCFTTHCPFSSSRHKIFVATNKKCGLVRNRPLFLVLEATRIDPEPKNGYSRVSLGSISVSALGVGTWAWGNKLLWGYDESMDEQLEKVFACTLDAGVNLFDSGDSYGTGRLNGRSELLLGKFTQNYKRSKPDTTIHIATKFAAYPWRLSRGSLVSACKGSLRRLQMEQLSLGQLHWSTNNYIPFDLQDRQLWDGLGDLLDQGLISAAGVSNYGPSQGALKIG
mmetsp:Transcript_42286/g.68576  ORF Transcript_42286/g.68576 Transcript_42286/m.68576 type:complete len:226 (-) Transcript_42286:99-776(-)